MNFRTKRH